MELERITSEDFAPLVATEFALSGSNPALSLRLASIGPAGAGLPGRRDPFSLIFHGPASPRLPQRIYRLSHPALAELEIFLVPIGPQPGGLLGYEAIFS